MRPDIVNLRQFYSSRLGRKVKSRLRRIARQHWPVRAGGATLGLGYATPLETALTRNDELVMALMPYEQGGLYWPVDGQNRSIIADAMRPPFAVNSLARIIVMHLFEHTARPEELLRVLWQILMPGGRMLLVVPNRRGLWARLGSTPFAMGTPYRLDALKTMLNDADFTLRDVSSALYAPPSMHPFWIKAWWVFEAIGSLLLPRSGGVFVIEVEKQIYAAVGERARKAATQTAWAEQAAPAYQKDGA